MEELKEEKEQPLEIRAQEIRDRLDEYLTRINAKIKQPERVDAALNLSYDEKKNLDSEQCGEYYDLLLRQSYFLQQEYNFHKGKLEWCEGILTYFIANYSNEDKWMKKDEKGSRLAVNNTAVKTLLKMLYEAKTYTIALEKLSDRMHEMAQSYKNMQYNKKKF